MVFLKYGLALAIIAITSYIGINKAKKLKEREYILREYVSFISTVEKEMKYTLDILPNILESSRMRLKTDLKAVIGSIVVDMLEEKNVEQSIIQNVNNLDQLDEYDKSIIISTLSNIGRNSIELDRSSILSSINIMDNQIKEATLVKNQSSKMYRVLGVTSGLIIVIFFI